MTTILSPTHSLPPPQELRDAGRLVGWIDGDLIRFRGFDSPGSASHAAAVAHLAMQRRLARGNRNHTAEHTKVNATGRPAAHVIRSFSNEPGNADAGDFAFEVRVPPPVDELRMRGMAYVMYRALRSSGVAWPLLRAA
jgi:hypothetical protein